ncbi:SprT family protein [Lederbergia sp. NSJ-179]|uniref:SprT family protein n=1 Tax=Lederbergia sp. NSJ-179 TaxID=2931402 RepID=UPI001FD24898|nr:SprT family protein [Lederbergia sp. NSJ-179]MCJ7842206.1 SprT family protein [Lederbergia sp. NSJ-179]
MTNEELQSLVKQISEQHFKKPFLHHAIFNGRLRTTGGRYLLSSHNIEINRKYLEEHGFSELEGIIKHELCHYHLHIEGKGYQHRDQDFKKLMKQVGAPRHCTPLQKVKKSSGKIYIYQCQDCAQIYERKRRVNTDRFVCGKCKGKLKQRKEYFSQND